MKDYKENDVFTWRYTEEYIKGLSNDYPYWCKSCICKYHNEKFIDTFWSDSNEDKSFSCADIGTKIELKFLGNLDDYRIANKSDRAYYLDADCMDLNHSNSTGDNFYIRKNAVKNEEKMKRVLQRNIKSMQDSIEYKQRNLKQLIDSLENFDSKMYLYSEGVSLEDETYEEME